MGLEGVELVMEVEDRFNVSISDAAAEKIQTVGEIYEFLMRRIHLHNDAVCQSAALFYPIRRILVDEFGAKRKTVRPATKLETLVDEERRHDFWKTIESDVSARLPRMRRSKWLQWHGDVFPEECSTVAQLVTKCVDLNRITDEFGKEDSEEVWLIVCKIVSEVCGVGLEHLTPETNFVNDLGFY